MSIEFIKFCNSVNIVPFCLPSHLTHLLQPLDITVFQPMKHYHAQAIEEAVRNGDIEFNRTTFLHAFQSIRNKTFKKSTIMSAWRAAGLVPYDPKVVLSKMREMEPILRPRTPKQRDSVYSNAFLTTPYG